MKSYTNYHLAISRTAYLNHLDKYTYIENSDDLSLSYRNPEYQTFISMLEKCGGIWGWNFRPKYCNNRIDIEKRLNDKETRFLVLQKQKQIIGYCLITAPKFRQNGDKHIIEIENFALVPEHTGKAYGRYFLKKIFDLLFLNYETIYLSSRSTNHKGVISFYQRMGMEVIHIEKDLPHDLIAQEKIQFKEWPQ